MLLAMLLTHVGSGSEGIEARYMLYHGGIYPVQGLRASRSVDNHTAGKVFDILLLSGGEKIGSRKSVSSDSLSPLLAEVVKMHIIPPAVPLP
jgi:hypothetical protein